MDDHFLDATKKMDFIRRGEVHVQIERALCDGLPYHRTIDEIPAADVVEVVRCKDCIHAGDRDCPIDWPKNGEDYCSFGERRADNG